MEDLGDVSTTVPLSAFLFIHMSIITNVLFSFVISLFYMDVLW